MEQLQHPLTVTTQKLLSRSANSVANTFTVTLPSNSWSTGRSVTAAVDSVILLHLQQTWKV